MYHVDLEEDRSGTNVGVYRVSELSGTRLFDCCECGSRYKQLSTLLHWAREFWREFLLPKCETVPSQLYMGAI